MKHKHHIIPRHAGGSDDPSNIIELTVEEHAEAHRILYEQYNNWQDYCAWQALSGRIGQEEILRMKQGAANRGRKRTPEQCERIKQAAIERNKRWAENPELRVEANRKRSEAMKGRKKSKEAIDAWRESKANGAGFSHSPETKAKIAKSLEGNQNRKL
jgi:phage protein D